LDQCNAILALISAAKFSSASSFCSSSLAFSGISMATKNSSCVFIPSKEYALLPIVIISSESFFACKINSKFSFFVEALNSKNLFSFSSSS
jgi:hypothetical protein